MSKTYFLTRLVRSLLFIWLLFKGDRGEKGGIPSLRTREQAAPVMMMMTMIYLFIHLWIYLLNPYFLPKKIQKNLWLLFKFCFLHNNIEKKKKRNERKKGKLGARFYKVDHQRHCNKKYCNKIWRLSLILQTEVVGYEEWRSLKTHAIDMYMNDMKEKHPHHRDRFSDQVWLFQHVDPTLLRLKQR